jgi:hypothetical protein
MLSGLIVVVFADEEVRMRVLRRVVGGIALCEILIDSEEGMLSPYIEGGRRFVGTA